MRVEAHHLAYDLEKVVAERLRSMKVPRAKSIAEGLTPLLMEKVPAEAFEMKPAWESGIFFLHGDTDEEYMRERQEELAAIHINIKRDLPITIYLSSFGGSCEAGMAFSSTIQEIRRAGRVVNVHVQGTAMSMGSLIVQACDLRTIEPYATMMVHEIYDPNPVGKTSSAEDLVAFNKMYEATLNGIYASRSGKSVEYWREKMLRRDVYFTARQAVSEGLVDRIRPIKPYPSKKQKKAEAAP